LPFTDDDARTHPEKSGQRNAPTSKKNPTIDVALSMSTLSTTGTPSTLIDVLHQFATPLRPLVLPPPPFRFHQRSTIIRRSSQRALNYICHLFRNSRAISPTLNNTIPKAAVQSNMSSVLGRMPVARLGQKYAWPDTNPNRLSVSVIRLKMKTTRISVSRPPGRFRSTTTRITNADVIIDSYLYEGTVD